MTLINQGASLPAPMWAVVRFLLSVGGEYPTERAQALLCPPSLLPDEEARAKDDTFRYAIKSLQELGLVSAGEAQLSLAPVVRKFSPADLGSFSDLLCRAVLDPDRNVSLSKTADHTGPKDLVRALAWFLTCDPFTPLGLGEVTQLQIDAFPSLQKDPIVNNVRWDRFVYWAPALGFASPSLLGSERSTKLVPDCTVAVRRTVLTVWEKGQHIDAADVVDRIVAELPVLPGGRYSEALGLPPTSTTVSASLSFALLCGNDQGWISIERRSDAAHDVFLADPDSASGTRRISEVTIKGGFDE